MSLLLAEDFLSVSMPENLQRLSPSILAGMDREVFGFVWIFFTHQLGKYCPDVVRLCFQFFEVGSHLRNALTDFRLGASQFVIPFAQHIDQRLSSLIIDRLQCTPIKTVDKLCNIIKIRRLHWFKNLLTSFQKKFNNPAIIDINIAINIMDIANTTNMQIVVTVI